MTAVFVGVLLAGCAGHADSPADLAVEACASARTVPMVGSAGEGSAYEFSDEELGGWVKTLTDVAETAADAAAGDAVYEDLSRDARAASDDLAVVLEAVEADRSVGGDQLAPIQAHLAALARSCEAVGE